MLSRFGFKTSLAIDAQSCTTVSDILERGLLTSALVRAPFDPRSSWRLDWTDERAVEDRGPIEGQAAFMSQDRESISWIPGESGSAEGTFSGSFKGGVATLCLRIVDQVTKEAVATFFFTISTTLSLSAFLSTTEQTRAMNYGIPPGPSPASSPDTSFTSFDGLSDIQEVTEPETSPAARHASLSPPAPPPPPPMSLIVKLKIPPGFKERIMAEQSISASQPAASSSTSSQPVASSTNQAADLSSKRARSAPQSNRAGPSSHSPTNATAAFETPSKRPRLTLPNSPAPISLPPVQSFHQQTISQIDHYKANTADLTLALGEARRALEHYAPTAENIYRNLRTDQKLAFVEATLKSTAITPSRRIDLAIEKQELLALSKRESSQSVDREVAQLLGSWTW
ncbi:hypothetical protein RQP46_003148 [Phenoliferia psychrophenolica]